DARGRGVDARAHRAGARGALAVGGARADPGLGPVLADPRPFRRHLDAARRGRDRRPVRRGAYRGLCARRHRPARADTRLRRQGPRAAVPPHRIGRRSGPRGRAGEAAGARRAGGFLGGLVHLVQGDGALHLHGPGRAGGALVYHLASPPRARLYVAPAPASLAAASAPAEPAPGSSPPVRKVPEVLPPLSLPGLDGRLHRLTDWKDRMRLVNFWASWCEPCRREIPLLRSLRRERAADRLEIVGIA